MTVADRLKSVKVEKRERPLWFGPEGQGPNGGITYSLLNKWLACKERARILMVDGWKPTEKWNHKIEYGNMFHLCDEWFSRSGNATTGNTRGQPDWKVKLLEYAQSLAKKYPYNQDEIDKWFRVCMAQFPEYIKYWQSHPDMMTRTPLLQEAVFDVVYPLPSGRRVRLRGKWDAVDLVGRGRDAVLVLHESKTKGEVDQEQITRQLTFDCQTMLYMVALQEFKKDVSNRPVVKAGGENYVYLAQHPIHGVRYNIVRRPLSGGKGTIIQKKGSKNIPAETREEYFERVAQYIREEPGSYFLRWDVPISQEDIQRFKDKFLDPCLENLCDWWQQVSGRHSNHPMPGDYRTPLSWITPFGLTGNLADGGYSELDEFIVSGSTIGLRQVNSLFPELQPEAV